MNCPVCSGVPMDEKEPSEGLFLDFCPTCGGTWLDAGEIERFGADAAAFKVELERASKTKFKTPFPCPRCAIKPMDRAWIAEAEVEFKVCPDCSGVWIDRERMLALRVHLKRLTAAATADAAADAAAVAPNGAPNNPRFWRRRGWINWACATAFLFWLGHRASGHSRPVPKAPPPEAVMSAADYERAARTRLARAESAEGNARWEEAMDEYKSAAEYYYAAILAAGGTPDGSSVARLEIEYAKVGEPIARIAVRLGRLAEAEDIQKVRLAVFERHHLAEEQAAVKKKLAEISAARKSSRR